MRPPRISLLDIRRLSGPDFQDILQPWRRWSGSARLNRHIFNDEPVVRQGRLQAAARKIISIGRNLLLV